jgi:hypothetical protein
MIKFVRFNTKGGELFIPIHRITKIKRYGNYSNKIAIHIGRIWETIYYKFDTAEESYRFFNNLLANLNGIVTEDYFQ